ncbi:hypothetical protein DWW17_10745 [Bacteroides sp. AF14-46]|nr:hypothetical protein DWW17_10745 [Bacteroides sp. AF14-46]HBB51715.1 hypothetical protein [Barnesiella sp.]
MNLFILSFFYLSLYLQNFTLNTPVSGYVLFVFKPDGGVEFFIRKGVYKRLSLECRISQI